MHIPTWLWTAWGSYVALSVVVALVWFGIQQGLAVASPGGGDTLTEVVRRIHVPPVIWFVGGGLLAGAIVGFVAWWPFHLQQGM